jgi:hypothetical protein
MASQVILLNAQTPPSGDCTGPGLCNITDDSVACGLVAAGYATWVSGSS